MIEYYIYLYTDEYGFINAEAIAAGERIATKISPKIIFRNRIQYPVRTIIEQMNNTLSGVAEYGADFLDDINTVISIRPCSKKVFPIINLDGTKYY